MSVANDESMRILPAYSGRGMYDRTCLGITGERIKSILFFLLEYASEHGVDEAELLATNLCTDQFGLGIVAYFPAFTIVDEEISHD